MTDIVATPAQDTVPAWKKWVPTRKWISGAVVGAAGILASWIVTGAFDDVERGMAGTLITSLAAGYFFTNADTIGGIPGADPVPDSELVKEKPLVTDAQIEAGE